MKIRNTTLPFVSATIMTVIGLFGVAAPVRAQKPSSEPLKGTLLVAGTDTMKELMERWVAAFTARHPGVAIQLSAKGALTAAPALAAGTADLVTLGRELTPPELAAFRKDHSYDPTAVRVAVGSYDTSGRTVALAFYVNRANPLAHLDLAQLGRIYCDSDHPLTTWGQLGLTGDWASRSIHPVGVNFPDGISNFIRLRTCGDGNLRTTVRSEHTGGPVNVLQRIAADVAADPDAIGYAGFANALPDTKVVAISEGGGPPVSGTRSDVAAAIYPLTRFIYVFLSRPPNTPIPALTLAFLRFIVSDEGQSLVAKDGVYLPLPRSILNAQRSVLDLPGTGVANQVPANPALPPFRPEPNLTGHFVSIGSDTLDDLMNLWIANFRKLEPNVRIEMQSRASVSVPAALNAGLAEIAPLSREMNPAEVEAFRSSHGYPPTEIAVALGSYNTPTRTVALTFYVNDANPLTRIDLKQLDAIWCTTLHRGAPASIIEWGQLGLTGIWEHRPIHLVGVLPPDGVPNFIARRVCEQGVLRTGIATEKNGGPTSVLTRIVADVAKDPDAIGYAGFHNRLPDTHPLAIADTSAGPFLEGSFDEVRAAAYPLTRYVYFYIDLDPRKPHPPALNAFLRYVLSLDGQRQVETEGVFLPLPANVAAQQRARIVSSKEQFQ